MARINEKEKNQSAYRKGLELENKSLKLSLQQLQDSSTSMQQQNISLEREISVLRERTKNDGVLSNVNEILSISFGAGLTYLFEKNYYASFRPLA